MFESREFSDGHVIFTYKYSVIFGVDQRGELSAFGGRSDHGETLMSTLIREYVEESHECITSITTLVQLLNNSKNYSIKKRRNNKFSFTAILPLDKLDFDAAREVFHTQAAHTTARPHSELKDIVIISLQSLMEALQTNSRSVGEYNLRYPSFASLKDILIK